jgi:succinyl-diaminopimelate desuccinylase
MKLYGIVLQNHLLQTKESLQKFLQKVIKETIGVDSNLSTTGGTSDARFISKHAKETVEFGPFKSNSS